MSGSYKKYRYRLECWGCQLLGALIPKLSRRGCIGMGQLLGAVAYWLDGRGRPIGLANIEAAFGDRFSAAERRALVRMSYQNFVGTMFSLFWSPRINPSNAMEFIEPVGFESIIERAAAEKRGIVFVCAHQGNWEWAAIAFAMVGGKANIVAEDFKNPGLTSLFSNLRSRGQHTIVPQDRSVLKLLRAVLRGETAALIGDLNLDPSGASVAVSAFSENGEALGMCATRMHAVLAKRGNALLVPALTEPLPGGRWRVIAQAPIESDAGNERYLAQKTWDVFEKSIRERPDLWLWAYKHFKFRPQNSTRLYPFYAGTSEAFDTLQQEAIESLAADSKNA